MVRIARYGKILDKLTDMKFHLEDGYRIDFEIHQMTVSLKHYHLALFCLISLRPNNRELSRELWRSINETDSQSYRVKTYIRNYAESQYFEILYSNTEEQKSKALSVANSRSKNPAYKGDILAININTHATITFRGINELRLYGFNPSAVYNCINERKSSFTHKGYVFVRLLGEHDEEA